GIQALGGLAADTFFLRGVRGDFDIVVGMYDEEGEGGIKVVGVEGGVNIGVGVRIIRRSVEQGRGFDIGGTGKG
ncbi:4-hydroxythreonine-4-phosphate dehydrogenase PdxA, partial [Bacillus licheniformis]|uniref:4-hydroxythreonine-4-phosphate dehydrogenase PdxA n=1 Tax=Bacillus licheniformis TaxID=1402 RepID=UPI00119E01E2